MPVGFGSSRRVLLESTLTTAGERSLFCGLQGCYWRANMLDVGHPNISYYLPIG